MGTCFFYFQLINNITGHYHPVWSDEFFYYINSCSFVENNTLKAALTYSGEGSVIFGADVHGFGYPLLHGCIGKIFGWHNLNFIRLNFVFLVFSIFVIWQVKSIIFKQKLWISIYILLFPFFPLYAFTYMQEIIHVFVAIILSVCIYLINNKEKNNTYIFFFILIIFIAGVFRGLWFFWLIGLIPLAKNKKQMIFYSLLFLLGIIISLVITKLFTEPVPNYFSSVIDLLKQGELKKTASSVYYNFRNNFFLYFSSTQDKNYIVYIFMKIMNMVSVLFFIFLAYRNKSKLNISLALIGLSNFLLLFLLYDAFDWREIRTMSPLFYFYILFIVLETKGFIKYVQLCCFLVIFALNIQTSKEWIAERNVIDLTKIHKEKMVYNDISKKIPNQKIILVDYIPNDHSWELLNLPLCNANNHQIRYIIPYYNVKKTHYDYILKRPKIDILRNKVIDNEIYVLIRNY
ncbi:MAG: hypothetical protein EAZ85_04880 [Bacteroidetes bacterium]|nr:MAG: hypothetical protein EAZ85_04880 [Bacteroidota bacterium]